jgi:hypothetical protein
VLEGVEPLAATSLLWQEESAEGEARFVIRRGRCALLGDDAFAVSWAAGRSLALEQAIAEALEVASP